jgi:hypothetical protein
VRVLIGSTSKMGTGTNVQKRLVALHHLDAPWKPAEVEQREGRILRQGNENAEVAIYRYVTEGSFDAYMWQALETKARFIAQVITGNNASRRAEDVGGEALSYAEVKAIASGNPAVLTLAEADAELHRLGVLKRNHADEQFLARRQVRQLPETIAALAERLQKVTADGAVAKAHADDPLTIGRQAVADEVGELGKRLEALQADREKRRIPLGGYHGLRFGIVLDPQFPPEVYLEGTITRHAALSREHHGPRAVLNALERLAASYGSEGERLRQDLAFAENQLRDYQARLGAPFAHEGYLAELTALRDQLKGVLAGPPGPEGGSPPLDEIVGRIKTLLAANTAEVAPRTDHRSISAEEPVAARVRRRLASLPAPDAVVEPAAPTEREPPATPGNLPSPHREAKPRTSFQESLTKSPRSPTKVLSF